MIVVERLRKIYGGIAAVQDLSFRIGPGEIVGLVGPNGAGKTTTLRSLAGIVTPTAGTIAVAGHDLAADPVAAKRRLAFVPDEPDLFEHLTVAEHLAFVARLYQVSGAEERAAALLAELELGGRRNAFPGELSRGMRQKLAMACALLHEPAVLLLDEPLTGLDPVGIRRMKDTIAARAAAGAAVLLSSHLLHLVEELCSGLLVLVSGRLVASGSLPAVLARHPDLTGRALEEVFLRVVADSPGPG